jgi:hypothetical protein
VKKKSTSYEVALGDIKRVRKQKFNPDRDRVNSEIDSFLKKGGKIKRVEEEKSEHCIGIRRWWGY